MNTNKIIYLTFDDGPSIYTKDILDILNKYNIKATFFIINTNSKYDYLIKREYDEDHTIGLHSYSHDYSKIYKDIDSYFNDLKKIEDKVISLTNYSSRIIRFPGGSSNTVSKNYNRTIMSKLTYLVSKRGYKYFDWNIDSKDSYETNKDIVCNNVINDLKYDSNVILLHDSKKASRDALECIIKYAINNNYIFSKITLDTKEVIHNINN